MNKRFLFDVEKLLSLAQCQLPVKKNMSEKSVRKRSEERNENKNGKIDEIFHERSQNG